MITWNLHKEFSPEFLAENHDLVLHDAFHRVKAFLLYPANCSCEEPCQCFEWRQKIILSLNTNHYNKLCGMHENPDRLCAMKALWNIPEDHSFRELHPNSYPIWMIEKELKAREEEGHFKMMTQLVWTFLRLGATYKTLWGAQETSVSEAITIILGDAPINTKVAALKKTEHFGGEKEYEKQFKHYKSVCHFIAALAIWKQEVLIEKRESVFVYPPPEQIERFLKIAHWFREKLLSLERRNVKGRIFLLREELCALPSWVQSDNIDFPIEPYEEKIQAILATAELVDPETGLSIPLPFH